MVFVRKAFFADVFVVTLSRVIRRVEIEKADRTVVLPNQFFKITVFDYHISEADV